MTSSLLSILECSLRSGFLKLVRNSQKDYDFTREKIKEILSTKKICNMDEFK